MAAASRAALECGASCSEAARALGAGMAALGLGMGRFTSMFSLTEQARAEEERALAEQRAGAAEAQREIERKLIAMGREALIAELAELDARLCGHQVDQLFVDDMIEPAPTIDRMPHSGASVDLVLRGLGVLPSLP